MLTAVTAYLHKVE